MIKVLKKYSLVFILLCLIIILTPATLACTSQEKVNMPIVLLTDFGSEDYRVSQIKGIIINNYPEARLIDASHSVSAFDIPTGAFILDIAAKEFPKNVVFVGIIAPYAQSETKYLVLTTNKKQTFVLPDNGLLTYVIKNIGIETIYQITNQELFDEPINELSAERIQGTTAALIASGYNIQDIGIPLNNPKVLDIQEPEVIDNILFGTVVYIDHYGNCITNISGETAGEFGVKSGDTIQVKSPQSEIPAKFGAIYSDVPQGEEIVFINNNIGVVQLSINLGNFAETYNIKAGTKIEIEK